MGPWASEQWHIEDARDQMWDTYRRDRDSVEEMESYRTKIGELSPALKEDIDYVYDKCMPMWVERKRKMKKQVPDWIERLMEDRNCDEIEGIWGPVSRNYDGE